MTKQKAVNKKLKEHVERAKTDMGELRDKCEVLEEEYEAVKKQLQTEVENQKFLGENGFGFGGSFLAGGPESSFAEPRVSAAAQDQDLAAVDELRMEGLDAELGGDSFDEHEDAQETPTKVYVEESTPAQEQLMPYTFKEFATSVPLTAQ